jgi:hypothetical protein
MRLKKQLSVKQIIPTDSNIPMTSKRWCCKNKEWSGEKGRGIARECYDSPHTTVTWLDDEGGGGDDSDNSDVYTWNVDFKLNINWIYSSVKFCSIHYLQTWLQDIRQRRS